MILRKLKKNIILSGVFILAVLLLPKIECKAEGTVSGGDIVEVTIPEELEIPVTELDLGDCPKEITVGTSQMISVLVIPANATENTFLYESDNPEVAAINALGRLTGKKVGTAHITVSCGAVKNSFTVNVVNDLSNIAVQDIEIGDVEEELEVDSKINISATIIPTNATNTAITYKSTNTDVATVNSSGEVKGIAPGQVTIEVYAGNVVKQISLTVKVATTDIRLNGDYLVLKPEETFQIEAIVQPKEAERNITYKSLDTAIATVTEKGLVTAQDCGDTAIIISNGDMQVTLSVIVNKEEIIEDTDLMNNDVVKETDTIFAEKVNTKSCPTISAEMLKYFYEKEKVLTVDGEEYTLFVDGKKIVNFENELITELVFEREEKGFSFLFNGGNDLCGTVALDISEIISDEEYLYLYNDVKKEYERLQNEDIRLLSIDTAGRYLVTSEKISETEVDIVFIIIGSIAIIIGVGAYIGIKKQYWFW